MLRNRRFDVHIGESTSRWKELSDTLLQGSVVAPKLFNLYTSDTPDTMLRKMRYADDEVLEYEGKTFSELEETLACDLHIMSDYYRD